jgi:hypothetical protein
LKKAKIGDKVIFKKATTSTEIYEYGCDKRNVKILEQLKFAVVKSVEVNDDYGNLSVMLENVNQWWKLSWFDKYNKQYELDFGGKNG